MITIEKIKDHNNLDSFLALTNEYLVELNEDLAFQSVNDELANPLAKYGTPGGLILLAYVNDQIAGCIALQPALPYYDIPKDVDKNRCCEMKRMYVKPAFRKNGIGNLLVSQLCANAQDLGYEFMLLDTLQRMQPAIDLYKRHGFCEIEAYYHNPISDVVFMRKKL